MDRKVLFKISCWDMLKKLIEDGRTEFTANTVWHIEKAMLETMAEAAEKGGI